MVVTLVPREHAAPGPSDTLLQVLYYCIIGIFEVLRDAYLMVLFCILLSYTNVGVGFIDPGVYRRGKGVRFTNTPVSITRRLMMKLWLLKPASFNYSLIVPWNGS